MSESFSIRKATSDDVVEITRIWKDGATLSLGTSIKEQDYEKFFESKVNAQNNTFQVWVAVNVEGEILGWQGLLPIRNNPAILFLFAESSTYISPQNKAKGLGKALVEYALDHAKKTDLQYISAFVAESNTYSLRIADALGWHRIGLVPASPKSDSSVNLIFIVYCVPALSQ